MYNLLNAIFYFIVLLVKIIRDIDRSRDFLCSFDSCFPESDEEELAWLQDRQQLWIKQGTNYAFLKTVQYVFWEYPRGKTKDYLKLSNTTQEQLTERNTLAKNILDGNEVEHFIDVFPIINKFYIKTILKIFQFKKKEEDNKLLNHTTHSTLPSVDSKAKRSIDILGALVGLSITVTLLPFISLLIYFDDPGPIFSSQTRVGLYGQEFRIWKFRSMIKDAEKYRHLVAKEAQGHFFKNKNDPRLTFIGAFLRKTCLDKFPQYWNVLKGEMSLVGPRPPTVNEVSQDLPHHFKRLHVKPGLTGEFQEGKLQNQQISDLD